MKNFIPNEIMMFLKKQAKWLSILTILLSLLLLALTIYQLANFNYTLDKTLTPDKTNNKPSPVKPQKPPKISPIFGTYVPKEEQIPSSILDLKVVGILKSIPASSSQVIIQLSDGREKIYQINDRLPGNAKIIRITSDYILINRQGKIEKLTLKKLELKFNNPPKPLELNND